MHSLCGYSACSQFSFVSSSADIVVLADTLTCYCLCEYLHTCISWRVALCCIAQGWGLGYPFH